MTVLFRHVSVGLGGPLNGIPREDGFDITVASEIMAILCLATDIEDLKGRLANIVIGYRYDRSPVYVRDLEVEGALGLIPQRCDQAKLGSNHLWYTCLCSRWSICQYRPWM